MVDGDWLKVAVEGGTYLLSTAVGLLVGVWNAGRHSGKQEAKLEAKIRRDIDELLQKAVLDMKVASAEANDNRQLLVNEFRETFSGLRQKINDVELEAERRFLPKNDFNDFREEYREDMRDIKNLITQNGKHHPTKP